MQRIGVLRIDRQSLPVKMFCFSQPPGMMMPEAFVRQLLNNRVLSVAFIGTTLLAVHKKVSFLNYRRIINCLGAYVQNA